MLATLARAALPVWTRATRPPAAPRQIAVAQRRILRRLLRRHARTAVGERFGLAAIAAAADPVTALRATVAPTEYADYADLIARVTTGEPGVLHPGRPLALAQTSGTTRGAAAGERFVPQNAALLRHHRRGGSAALARLVSVAGTRLLDGRLLMLGGSTALDRSRAIPAGDLSGIAAARLPRWIAERYEPGPAIAAEPDWERRLALIAERCAGRDLRLAAGIPSWLLVLFRALRERTSVARVRDAFPGLGALIHGGHAIDPFLPALRAELGDDTWMMEVYPASECFVAIGERPWRLGEGRPPALELLTRHGAYLEFLPEDGGEAVGAEALDDGRLYRLLVTTPGGLVRYQIGDLVLGCGPGRVRVAGRTKARLSVFGEHVEGCHLADALGHAAAATGAAVAHYHVAPVLPDATEPRGRHEWLIAFATPPRDPAIFAAALDQRLSAAVLDYAAHRAGDAQLLPPTVRVLDARAFDAFLAERGRLDGQRKVPQAWSDRTIADALIAHATGDSP